MPAIVRFAVLAYLALEALVLVGVARAIGTLPAFGLLALGGIAGGLLLRRRGLGLVAALRQEAGSGRGPTAALAAAGARAGVGALAALLLMLPGFLTDIAALVVLIGPLRRPLWRMLKRRAGVVTPRQQPGRTAAGRVVELDPAEYRSRDDDAAR